MSSTWLDDQRALRARGQRSSGCPPLSPGVTRASRVGRLGIAGGLTIVAIAAGCTPRKNALQPYRDDPAAAAVMEEQAVSACRARRAEVPPNPFRTDGCSMWPNARWIDCCVVHDMAYWCGGSTDARREADERLRQCVDEAGGGWPRLMYWGVRVLGPGWQPFPWRWGFGWPWLGDP